MTDNPTGREAVPDEPMKDEDVTAMMEPEELAALMNEAAGEIHDKDAIERGFGPVVPEPEPAKPEPEAKPETPEAAKAGGYDYLKQIEDADKAFETASEAQKKALDDYNDGEISYDDYLARLKALTAEAAKAATVKAIAESRRDAVETEWKGAVASFQKANPEVWADQAVLERFDARVREVSREGSPWANQPFARQLEVAHRLLLTDAELLGLKIAPKAPPGAKLGTIPPTLARVPASEMATDDDPFAALRRVVATSENPDEIEREMSKLTPEQMEEYARTVG